MAKKIFTLFLFITISFGHLKAQHSVARQWNEVLLEAIRHDFARPTIHARNLFHISAAMYDAWAAYDSEAKTFLLGKTVGNFTCPFEGIPAPSNIEDARERAISYAAYRLIKYRFQYSPGANFTLNKIQELMTQLGYDINFTSADYASGSPAALGNYIAQNMIELGLYDGSNESDGFFNQYYQPVNPPLIMVFPGNPDIVDLNRWQPLSLTVFIDQSGNVIPGNTPPFLSPEWGQVTPFALQPEDRSVYNRDGFDYWVYHDPGPPPHLDTTMSTAGSEEYKWNFELVTAWSSHLDPSDSVMWDISPASSGNIQTYPTTWAEYHDFYDFENGGDPGAGYAVNPKTGLPYEPQMVPRGDYTRVLAEFWADGPNSETPPGHWFTILNYVNDNLPEKRFRGIGPVMDDLEWDIKSYFTLAGAMHDVAVTVWGIKGWYDYIRPVSALRAMAEKGQSSDSNLPSYHPAGVRLIPGLIELVEPGDTLAGDTLQNVGKIKFYAWRGPGYIANPQTDEAGVGWILAENWFPYQRPTFVTPPFAGYVSGHSTFSRAAAEVLTSLTGDPYFPGGMGEFPAPKNEFLVFEEGPSRDITLQWATYRDASDQCSLSRIWGGIHPPADDIPGRFIGMAIAEDAFNYAESYFYKDDDADGYFSNLDCDDGNNAVYPGAMETCNEIDDNCDAQIDEGLQLTFYTDNDGDNYGDATATTLACEAPGGFVTDNTDCNDSNSAVYPGAMETCNEIDDNCDGTADEEVLITFYLDLDGDNYGDMNISTTACTAPGGYVPDNTDCDDGFDFVHPGAMEIFDGLDNDCNGLVDDGVTATNESHPQQVKLFPNPTSGEVTVSFEFSGTLKAKIFRPDGILLIEQPLIFSNKTAVLNVKSLPQGTFLLKLEEEDGKSVYAGKVVKI